MNQIQPNIGVQFGNGAHEKPLGHASLNGQLPEPADHHGLEFIGGERATEDFERAAKHSKWVQLLKILLPLVGVLIIVIILAALVLRPTLPVDISIGNAGIEDGKLVMNNPKLNGFDENNLPYFVEAMRAIQSVEDPTQVELDRINAKLPMKKDVWANIEAGNGSFNATDKKLELGGGVKITTTDGMKMNLKDAYIDMKAGSVQTDREIVFTSENANISSGSMQIFDNGDRIIFDTKVRLTIQPQGQQSGKKSE